MIKPPTKPELPAWVFLLLRIASFGLVLLAAWLATRCRH